LFGDEHRHQAQHLLGVMIDLARYGSRTELRAKRDALADIGRVEEEVRELAAALRRKLRLRDDLMHTHLIYGGIEDDQADALGRAAEAVALQSWSEPRLHNTDYSEAINSRKTTRDALVAMLYALDGIAALLAPVKLTDRARAAIFNVSHDTDDAEQLSPEAIKKARADLRRR
jgi:hypothetical protein